MAFKIVLSNSSVTHGRTKSPIESLVCSWSGAETTLMPKKAEIFPTDWQRDRPIDGHVCQFGVMTDYEIVTLTQHGAVDFKTIAVFLFHCSTDIRYFSRSKLDAVCTAVYQETDKLYKNHHYVHHHRRQLRALGEAHIVLQGVSRVLKFKEST